MKFIIFATILFVMFSTYSWAGCWIDSECPSDKVCECTTNSSSGNCSSEGTCVNRDKSSIQTNDMKTLYNPIVTLLEGELKFTSSKSVKKALSTTESSSKSCKHEWHRMINNLRNEANSYCSQGVNSYGNMNTYQDKRSDSLYFCTVKTVITCN